MQGRLVPPEPGRFQSFPRARWRDEFPYAAAAHIDAIEWIYDAYGADLNPLGSDAGLAEMRSLAERFGVAVVSVCADYFMDFPIVHATGDERSELFARFSWLLERCGAAGVRRVVVPFVDASKIEGEDHVERALSFLRELLPRAEAMGVEIHLETALGPSKFAAFLARLPHPMVKVNYDAGNSAALGFAPAEELAAYGERLGSVHVKDRVLGGTTVPLGTGNADLPALFEGLARLRYRGDYVLQVARGVPGDELQWSRDNAAFVRTLAR
jgi:hexulose-6-phosphate isomerase